MSSLASDRFRFQFRNTGGTDGAGTLRLDVNSPGASGPGESGDGTWLTEDWYFVAMTYDAATGQIDWTPAAGDAGNHAVHVRVEDGRGGSAEQTYTLSVLDDLPNRPPRITSTPPIDAAVNTPYAYQVIAEDPDQDVLAYSLPDAPDGMAIDPGTGLIEWTPGGGQLHDDTVAVQVSDHRGGIATQVYTVMALGTPGNKAGAGHSDMAA